MSFELTDQGVSVQTLDEILGELEAAARAPDGIHPQLDVSATSVFGQVFAIVAEREVRIQQAVRALHQSFGPKATGLSLANIALLTGTVKRGATKSVVDATVTLTAGTTLPAHSRANVDGDTQAVFETLVDVTNSLGITADVAVTFTAVNAGPVRAPSGKLTVINTPVSGWLAVTNAFDADVGLDIETDPELRTRRVEELRIQGSTALQAIEADVEIIPGVLDVRGFENLSDIVVAGLPPHSYEIVIFDGVSPQANNNAVAQTLFDGGPAGIEAAHGIEGTAASGTAVDDEGDSHIVAFTRAQITPVYATITITVNDDYPVDGDAQVKAAFVAAVNQPKGIGRDVVLTKLYAAIYTVAGVVDVTGLLIGSAALSQFAANMSITDKSVAVGDSSRITVIS